MPGAPRPVEQRTVLLAGLGNYTHPATRHSIGQYVLRPLLQAAEAHDRTVREALCQRPPQPAVWVPPRAPTRAWALERAAGGWLARTSVLLDTLPPKGTARRYAPERYPYVLADVHVYLPKYLMNENGRGVAAACAATHVPPAHVLLLHDELDRAFGKVSLKLQGSAGGHNGVRSVQAALRAHGGAADVARVRIGIDRPASPRGVGAYVLAPMPPAWIENLEHGPLVPTLWAEVARWIALPFVP